MTDNIVIGCQKLRVSQRKGAGETLRERKEEKRQRTKGVCMCVYGGWVQ